eukprot:m.212788 g.212788  ORF g.212788 m.212788 type:complete len:619 (-) comp17170_c0_seq1:3012-4868(-)
MAQCKLCIHPAQAGGFCKKCRDFVRRQVRKCATSGVTAEALDCLITKLNTRLAKSRLPSRTVVDWYPILAARSVGTSTREGAHGYVNGTDGGVDLSPVYEALEVIAAQDTLDHDEINALINDGLVGGALDSLSDDTFSGAVATVPLVSATPQLPSTRTYTITVGACTHHGEAVEFFAVKISALVAQFEAQHGLPIAIHEGSIILTYEGPQGQDETHPVIDLSASIIIEAVAQACAQGHLMALAGLRKQFPGLLDKRSTARSLGSSHTLREFLVRLPGFKQTLIDFTAQRLQAGRLEQRLQPTESFPSLEDLLAFVADPAGYADKEPQYACDTSELVPVDLESHETRNADDDAAMDAQSDQALEVYYKKSQDRYQLWLPRPDQFHGSPEKFRHLFHAAFVLHEFPTADSRKVLQGSAGSIRSNKGIARRGHLVCDKKWFIPIADVYLSFMRRDGLTTIQNNKKGSEAVLTLYNEIESDCGETAIKFHKGPVNVNVKHFEAVRVFLSFAISATSLPLLGDCDLSEHFRNFSVSQCVDYVIEFLAPYQSLQVVNSAIKSLENERKAQHSSEGACPWLGRMGSARLPLMRAWQLLQLTVPWSQLVINLLWKRSILPEASLPC